VIFSIRQFEGVANLPLGVLQGKEKARSFYSKRGGRIAIRDFVREGEEFDRTAVTKLVNDSELPESNEYNNVVRVWPVKRPS